MWCIPKITPEFIKKMEEVLTLYAKPYNSKEPVLCFDEKSKQLTENLRPTKNIKAKKPRKKDYEYKRNGTRNIFMSIEPKGGHREIAVTKYRKKIDFVKEIKRIINLPRYKTAKKIHFVLDNLNIHFEKSFFEIYGKEEAKKIMRRIKFHHTPKHASWLNMAEIEIGILDRQCIPGRIPTEDKLKSQIRLWKKERNKNKAVISWKFTVKDARKKFKYEIGSKLS